MKKNMPCSYMTLSKPVMAILLLLVLLQVNISAVNSSAKGHPAYFLKDTVKYVSFTGRVLDKNTLNPVIFASIQLEESNVGVVTNSDGEFIIKVPSNMINPKLAITHLGYKNAEVDLSQLTKSMNIIYLEAAIFPIEEIKIRTNNAEDLLRAAIRNKSLNYSSDPVMMTSFYRETIKQNKNYVAVAEAVIDIYKAPYYKTTDIDRSKIFKGRKSQDVKKMDTVLFKFRVDLILHFTLISLKIPEIYSLKMLWNIMITRWEVLSA
jgi:hypothetical protein